MNPKGFYGFKGDIVLPWDAAYGEARLEWNRRIDKFPRAIAYCESREDVSRCISWALRRGVPIRVRGGGHHYEGYSTGSGALVIDLSRMNRVYLKGDALELEGGVRNRELYAAIADTGRPFPGGTCPTVGASGFAQGGGWGLSCRYLGLGCDSLMSAELIDAYGRAITANAHCNEELFWALRGGGGGNFGAVVSLTFKLPPQTGEVTLIQLFYPGTDAAAQAQFWETWQSWLPDADERVTLQAGIYRSVRDGRAVSGRGIYYGPPQEAQAEIAPLLALPGCVSELEGMTYAKAIRAIGERYPASEKFKSTGRFVTKPLEAGEISRIVASLDETPEGSVYTGISLYALGGAVARRSRSNTAFFYRDARYIAGIQSVWTQDEYEAANVGWVDCHFPYLAGVTAGSFVNFPYGGLKDYMQAYYGGNAAWLRRVKRIYDPCNVFRFQQSIQ